jgi:hypothetical protein
VEPGRVEQVLGRGGVAIVNRLFKSVRFARLERRLIDLLQLLGVLGKGADGVVL